MRQSLVLLVAVLAAALICASAPLAAAPTEAQLGAIKANCRSDFMSNCWGTPRGGAQAFQCLKQHMSKLSPGCAQAVKAVEPPPPPKPAVVAKKPEPKPAPKPAAAPASAPAPMTTAAKPAPAPAPKAAAAPAPKPASKTATAAPKPQATVTHHAAAPAPRPAAVPAPAPAPTVIIGNLPPRKKFMVKRNCNGDLRTYCAGISYGDGRLLRCLEDNMPKLSPNCQGVLASLAR